MARQSATTLKPGDPAKRLRKTSKRRPRDEKSVSFEIARGMGAKIIISDASVMVLRDTAPSDPETESALTTDAIDAGDAAFFNSFLKKKRRSVTDIKAFVVVFLRAPVGNL